MTHLDKLISEATVIRPGDTLFIVLRAQLTTEEFGHVKKQITDQMPDGIQTVILAGEIHLSVLRPNGVAQ